MSALFLSISIQWIGHKVEIIGSFSIVIWRLLLNCCGWRERSTGTEWASTVVGLGGWKKVWAHGLLWPGQTLNSIHHGTTNRSLQLTTVDATTTKSIVGQCTIVTSYKWEYANAWTRSTRILSDQARSSFSVWKILLQAKLYPSESDQWPRIEREKVNTRYCIVGPNMLQLYSNYFAPQKRSIAF